MKAWELQRAIDALTASISPQMTALEALKRQLDDALSREWIETNGVTNAHVRRSSGDGVPWFNSVYEFGRWMRSTAAAEPWAEWNGRIYSSAELMDRRMSREAPGRVEHLTNG